MRKLSKKNKTYIAVFSFIFVALFLLIIGFIIYKKNILDVKYDVAKNSYTYNASGQLVVIDNDTFVKRDLIGRYYVDVNNKKENLGYNAVIFEKDLDTILLFGKFYDVMEDGKVEILNGFNKNSIYDTKFYKISDRKYLMVSNKISSKENVFSASDYLLINIDRKGNGLLYNHSLNVKSFKDLVLFTDKYNFNVNEELLIYNGETIYLNKINGSSNEYTKENESEQSSSDVYNDEEQVVTQKEIVEKYINKKTTIVDYNAYVDKVIIDYVIFDPLTEYSKVYYKLFLDGKIVKENELNINDSSIEINDLDPSTSYYVEFYYDYLDDSNNITTYRFDAMNFRTKDIKAVISLEKISPSGVIYKVKVEDGYILDDLQIDLYVDDQLIDKNKVNTSEAANTGAVSSFNKIPIGNYGVLKLANAIYKGRSIEIDASYKFKI